MKHEETVTATDDQGNEINAQVSSNIPLDDELRDAVKGFISAPTQTQQTTTPSGDSTND